MVGFADDRTLVMPMGAMTGICRGARVRLTSCRQTVALGEGVLGRVLDGTGRPIDGRGPIAAREHLPVWPEPLAAMRPTADQPAAGHRHPGNRRAADGRPGPADGHLLRLGRGQERPSGHDQPLHRRRRDRHRPDRRARPRGPRLHRAGPGPRGAGQKSVVVVSTSDEPPLLRVQAGAVAAAVAEYFRDRGADVLLLVDSLTRLATAQRQIGLVAGEPPTTKGYTPSVFNLLPQLLERSGRTETGSITGFYTVLAEGDDLSEPDQRRRAGRHRRAHPPVARAGQPRAVPGHRLPPQRQPRDDRPGGCPAPGLAARELNRLMTLYGQVEDMVGIGAYRPGASLDFDLAIRAMPLIRAFLTQGISEQEALENTHGKLLGLHQQIMDIRASLEGAAGHGGDRRTQ